MEKRNGKKVFFGFLNYLSKSPETLLVFTIMLLLIVSKRILTLFIGNDAKLCAASIILSIFCFLIPSLVYMYLAHFRHGKGVPSIKMAPPTLVSIPTIVSSLFLMISGAILIVLLGIKSDNFMFSVLSVFEPGKNYSFGVIFLMVWAPPHIPPESIQI